jgi:hypothetical protein
MIIVAEPLRGVDAMRLLTMGVKRPYVYSSRTLTNSP